MPIMIWATVFLCLSNHHLRSTAAVDLIRRARFPGTVTGRKKQPNKKKKAARLFLRIRLGY